MLGYIRSINTFPLKILGDLGVEKHLNKLTISHNELGDEINIPVSVMPILFWWILTRSELLPQVGQIQRGCLSAIIFISVKV
jgi:hypothetical protein